MTDVCGFLLDGRNPANFVFPRENADDCEPQIMGHGECSERVPTRRSREDSLNAGMSGRKDGSRLNLGEQVRQVRDPPSEVLCSQPD
jgi:hypothetical protein